MAGLPVGPAEVIAWLENGDDKLVEDTVGRCISERWCQDCSKFHSESEFLRPFGRCYPCYNAHQASPATKAWLAAVDELIARAPKHLQVAWQAARQGPKAVSYKRLAELTNQSEAELRAAWEAAGLPLRPAGRPRKNAATKNHEKLHSGDNSALWRPL